MHDREMEGEAVPASVNVLTMRVAGTACIDDGETGPWAG